jgi:hypothetical protein
MISSRFGAFVTLNYKLIYFRNLVKDINYLNDVRGKLTKVGKCHEQYIYIYIYISAVTDWPGCQVARWQVGPLKH